MSVHDEIKSQVTTNPVVLYMKGTPDFPQCGFSAAAVQMLRACGVQEFLFGERAWRNRRSAKASRSLPTGRRFPSFTWQGSSLVARTSCARCSRLANCRSW